MGEESRLSDCFLTGVSLVVDFTRVASPPLPLRWRREAGLWRRLEKQVEIVLQPGLGVWRCIGEVRDLGDSLGGSSKRSHSWRYSLV